MQYITWQKFVCLFDIPLPTYIAKIFHYMKGHFLVVVIFRLTS